MTERLEILSFKFSNTSFPVNISSKKVPSSAESVVSLMASKSGHSTQHSFVKKERNAFSNFFVFSMSSRISFSRGIITFRYKRRAEMRNGFARHAVTSTRSTHL